MLRQAGEEPEEGKKGGSRGEECGGPREPLIRVAWPNGFLKRDRSGALTMLINDFIASPRAHPVRVTIYDEKQMGTRVSVIDINFISYICPSVCACK